MAVAAAALAGCGGSGHGAASAAKADRALARTMADQLSRTGLVCVDPVVRGTDRPDGRTRMECAPRLGDNAPTGSGNDLDLSRAVHVSIYADAATARARLDAPGSLGGCPPDGILRAVRDGRAIVSGGEVEVEAAAHLLHGRVLERSCATAAATTTSSTTPAGTPTTVPYASRPDQPAPLGAGLEMGAVRVRLTVASADGLTVARGILHDPALVPVHGALVVVTFDVTGEDPAGAPSRRVAVELRILGPTGAGTRPAYTDRCGPGPVHRLTVAPGRNQTSVACIDAPPGVVGGGVAQVRVGSVVRYWRIR